MKSLSVTLNEINIAHSRIKPFIHRTPILTSSSIDKITDSEIYFKCENFQKVGSFKARGAFNKVFSLKRNKLQNGLATHSSGNHAQAVALAAKTIKTNAWIVMPLNAPKVKKNAVKEYNANIIECEPTIEARENELENVIKKHGASIIHPYDSYEVIIGQGTASKEFYEDVESTLDFILAPIGGGGLIGGTALVTQHLSPKTKIIGAEPKVADDAYQSLKSGLLTKNHHPPISVADGLLTNLGMKNFDIIKEYVHDIILVEEHDILNAMKLVWERMKIIIEPSSACPLAAVINNPNLFAGKKIGIILSGGNVNIENVLKKIKKT